MISLEDLRIPLFASIPEKELSKLLPLVQRRHYEERQTIFRRGEKADFFGILARGRAYTEYGLAQGVTVSLTSIKPGFVFGWRALAPAMVYEVTVTCQEPCDVLLIPGGRLRELLSNEKDLGVMVYRSFNGLLLDSMDRRINALLTILSQHPELAKHIQRQEA